MNGLGERVKWDGDAAVVEPGALAEVLRFLRYEAEPNYDALADLTAVDNQCRDSAAPFSVHYCLRSGAAGPLLRLIVPCAGGPLPSALELWPAADWFEREIYDLFGIEFSGRGQLRRLLLPADFVANPLRKDYPLTGSGEARAEFDPNPAPSLDPLSEEGEVAVLELHAAGGGLRLQVEVEGDRVRAIRPDLGYVHAGLEKLGESLTYRQCAQLAGRIGRQSSFSGELALALAVERLMGIEAPPRAVYLRALWCELGRMAAHMAWLGEQAELAGATAVWQRAWCARDEIRVLLDTLVPGAAAGLICPGGTVVDLEPEFAHAAAEICGGAPSFIDEIDQLFAGHPLWERRTRGLGALAAAAALAWGASGPVLRAAGVAADLRCGAASYAPYGDFDFAVPVGENGDVYDRCRVRLAEIAASADLVAQALAGLPDGPHLLADRRFAGGDVATPEGLVHHFALWMDGHGLQPPAGAIYCGVEAPGGELGIHLVSDGTDRPYRLHFRTPSFAHLQCYPQLVAGLDLDEAALVLGSLNIAAAEVDR
ncbi:MAG: NADH-quinone oxidoreductase subunit C [Candidatus Latescibacteria bacterium]|nr:NADH-quinone oxidoreductase subunit C [Candidatus Latescibacterota bacterium]